MKKTTRDIIILHMFTKNYDQMMYGSWDMLHDRQMDEWMNGRADGQVDRQTDRKSDI